jgi:succinate dehydrogenase / fumarate reductase iron-sulfur subunit
MKVKIQRQQSPVSEPYWETFDADVPGDMSIAGLIDHLNYRDDILDENGRKTTRIGWECSCLQGICGSCAMVINEVPALACETFVKDLKGDVITIRPLRKFPVIHDLLVDRSVIH